MRQLIFSLESAAGLSLSGLPDGPTIGLFGQVHVHASHSAQPASEEAKPTTGISGPKCSALSTSAGLQSFLASKLRAKMGSDGSTEYSLTWKERVTPAGRPICALRASGRRISGNDCTGWASPQARNGKGGSVSDATMGKNSRPLNEQAVMLAGWPTPDTMQSISGHGARGGKVGNGSQSGASLSAVAALAGWPTPDANAMDGGEGLESFQARQAVLKEKHGNGNGAGMPLAIASQLAGWPTPMANDSERRGQVEAIDKTLNNTAMLAGWATPRAEEPDWTSDGYGERNTRLARGMTAEQFFAKTGKRAVLDAAFSRWLMGFPAAWDKASPNYSSYCDLQAAIEALDCTVTAMP